MSEIWKDIKGYKGLYQVSNLGRIKCLERINNTSDDICSPYEEKILKFYDNGKGYLFVILRLNGKSKKYYVHRLVALHFISNPNKLNEVNHLDEDKTNNKASNLEWINHKDNCNYGTRNQRVSDFKKGKCFYTREIYCLENNKIYNSIKQASFELDISKQYICDVLKGRQKQAKGYTFRYVKNILFKEVNINGR